MQIAGPEWPEPVIVIVLVRVLVLVREKSQILPPAQIVAPVRHTVLLTRLAYTAILVLDLQ